MNKEQEILSEITILSNRCPCCDKERFYRTKCGFDRANKLNLNCKSCTNSIIKGGTGAIYKEDKKFCSGCKVYKKLNEYFLNTEYGKDKYHSCCKKCAKVKSEKYHRLIHRFNKYNIDKDYYDTLVVEQNNKCKICLTATHKFHIDHCHKSGKVRGLLCSKCNKALGLVNDNVEILENAIKYLKINE